MTALALAGGSFRGCPVPSATATRRAFAVAAAKKPKKKPHKVIRQLWSKDNHGKFQTYGHNSVATVRGTEWITQDRCDGTLTRVIQGTVTVRNNKTHRTVTITAGHSYLARR